MKKLVIFFILTFFFQLKNIEATAQTCDSVVTNYDQSRSDTTELWKNNFLTIDSFSNHLLRSSSLCFSDFNFPFGWPIFDYATYSYDVSNRLSEILEYYSNGQTPLSIAMKIDYTYDSNSRLLSKGKFNWNSTHWMMYPGDYTEYYYSASGKDSVQITGIDTGTFIQTSRTNFTYDASDSLIGKGVYYNDGSGWIQSSFTVSDYTPYGNNYIRKDSTYYFAVPGHLYKIEWYVLNPSGDTIHSDNIDYGDGYGYVSDNTFACNHEIASYSGKGHGGSPSEYSAAYGHNYYDSLCRVQFYTNYNESYIHGHSYHQGYYYYTDCSHMILSGVDTIRACVGDTVRPNLFYQGGQSPYQISWSPATGLTSSTTLNPGIIVSQNTAYTITVTDSNGIVAVHNVFVQAAPVPVVNITATIDSVSLCNSVTLHSDTGMNYNYEWYLNGERLNNPANHAYITKTLSGQYVVLVTIHEPNLICRSTDTIVLNLPHASPAVTVTRICDDLIAHTNTGINFQWNDSGTPIPGETNDTLHITSYGDFAVTVTDNSGCSNTSSFIGTHNTYLTLYSHATCHDSCEGVISTSLSNNISYQNTAIADSYLWSTGDTTPNINHLCIGNYSVTVTDINGCVYQGSDSVLNFPIDSFILNSSSVAGLGSCTGIAGLDQSYLTNVYSYHWDNGSTLPYTDSLCSGWHYLTTISLHDGCGRRDSVFTPVQPPDTNCTISISASQATCPGQCDVELTVNSWGQYPWSIIYKDFTQQGSLVCPGDYHAMIIDANGCVDSATVNVPVVPIPSAIINVTPSAIPCSTAVNATVTNVTQPIYYYWSNGDYDSSTYICPGLYELTIYDDNNCGYWFPFIIFQPPCIVSAIAVSPSCNSLCDGTINTISNGTAPYSYVWTGGDTTSSLTNLCAGTYTVTMTDSLNCIDTKQFVLTDPAPLSLALTGLDASCIGCQDGEIFIANSGGTPPYTLTVSPQTGFILNDTIHALPAGDYIVCETDSNGCSLCDTIHIYESPNEISIIKANHIYISPNPFSGSTIFHVDASTSAELIVMDNIGKIVRNEKIIEPSHIFKRNDLPAGAYFYSIKDKGVEICFGKLVIVD